MITSLLLVGCTETLQLVSLSTGKIAHGKLIINANPPHNIEVMLDGTHYTGEWDTKPIDTPAHIFNREGYSKHYQRHARGEESAHLSNAEAVLKADNGATLKCDWIAHADKGHGECIGDNGQHYKLTIPSPD
jgi:hypothetical protein